MKAISTTEFRENFSAVLSQAHYGKEPIVVTRRAKPLVLLLPVSQDADLDELTAIITVALDEHRKGVGAT